MNFIQFNAWNENLNKNYNLFEERILMRKKNEKQSIYQNLIEKYLICMSYKKILQLLP
jgi:hypothetical protein